MEYAAPEAAAAFMRPEISQKATLRPSLDVYSFGIVLLQMLYVDKEPRLGGKVRTDDSCRILGASFCFRFVGGVVVGRVSRRFADVDVYDLGVVVLVLRGVAAQFEAPQRSRSFSRPKGHNRCSDKQIHGRMSAFHTPQIWSIGELSSLLRPQCPTTPSPPPTYLQALATHGLTPKHPSFAAASQNAALLLQRFAATGDESDGQRLEDAHKVLRDLYVSC